MAILDNRITLPESHSTTLSLSASYCGSCGRATMQVQISVYQPFEEPPPLTRAEYEQSRQTYKVAVPNLPAAGYARTMEVLLQVNLIPKIFADHLVAGYRDLIQSYRDGQALTNVPGNASPGSG